MTARGAQLDPNEALEWTIGRYVLNRLIDRDAHRGHDRDRALDFALDRVSVSKGHRPVKAERNAVDLDTDGCLEAGQRVLGAGGDRRAEDVANSLDGEPPWLGDRRVADGVAELCRGEGRQLLRDQPDLRLHGTNLDARLHRRRVAIVHVCCRTNGLFRCPSLVIDDDLETGTGCDQKRALYAMHQLEERRLSVRG